MPNYRRNYVPGGTYFFTCVTYLRRPILTTDLGRRCLRDAWKVVTRRFPFETVAVVLLPDHIHTVWTLPPGDDDYSVRWRRIKEEFTREWLAWGGSEATKTPSHMAHGQRGIWQKRYWEHTIQDEEDLKRCVDYVHWNPYTHGLVERVSEWPWSTFHRFVALGEYGPDWEAKPFQTCWRDLEAGEAI